MWGLCGCDAEKNIDSAGGVLKVVVSAAWLRMGDCE
jgi:hypothetical protein